jgi:peptidoglycan/LPS O-acetylase OafA/YrhL
LFIKNNFDFLRLLFATIVCVVHAQQLSAVSDLTVITSFLSSTVAVKAFFVVSGYLIFMSYERSSSVWSYIQKRVRRIYPAYFTIVVACAIGLVTITNLTVSDYFSSAWIKYILANLTFLNFLKSDLPGVFEGNALQAVNGALWTLKIEVLFYLSVPVFAFVFRKYGHVRCMTFFYLLSFMYVAICNELAVRTGHPIYEEFARQLPGQLCYFLSGALYYFYASKLKPYLLHLALASIAVLALNSKLSLLVLEPFALATLVVFAATYKYMGNFGKYGDFSYGVYILHFPIIQILIQFGIYKDAPWLFLSVVLLLTIAGAIAMWHLVEKQFLSRTSHYVSALLK